MTPINEKILGYCRVIHKTPREALKLVFNKVTRLFDRILVVARLDTYICTQVNDADVSICSEFVFRSLNSDDYAILRDRNDRFGEHARLYYDKRKIASAFGVFVDGELGHISWTYTKEEYKREPYERFRLENGEVEIVNCYTSDKHRGKGLYPFAIRLIVGDLLDRGFERILMNIEPDNDASRRGILKAGLRPYGRVWHIRSPIIKKWRGCYYRRIY